MDNPHEVAGRPLASAYQSAEQDVQLSPRGHRMCLTGDVLPTIITEYNSDKPIIYNKPSNPLNIYIHRYSLD